MGGLCRGDIREIVGEPVFVPLYKLFLVYGGVFRLSFGPKSFVIVSDPAVAKQILLTNASRYSKGILSEILDFVMGKVATHLLRCLSCFLACLTSGHSRLPVGEPVCVQTCKS